MLVYKGMLLEHWREAFIGQDCAQCFYIIMMLIQKTLIKIFMMADHI